MKFKNFVKQVKAFFKCNFKEISFSFVAIVSALVLFCVPVSALSTSMTRINVAYNLYATNSSIREGDFSGINWGIDFQTIPFDRNPIYPQGTSAGYYEVIYNKLANSYEMQGKYLLTTFQIIDNSFFLEKDKTYKVTLTLFFKMATTKTLKTDYLKFAFWDWLDNSQNPYLVFYDTSTIEWASKYDSKLGGYVSKHTFYLRNDFGRDINPTHLRFAIRFKSTLKLWNGNSWGFYDRITIEESSFTWLPGDVSIFNGMGGISKMIEYAVLNIPILSNLITLSISLGMTALVVGFAPSIISSFTHKSNSKDNSSNSKNNSKYGGGYF